MAKFLQILAVLCALAVIGIWFALGHNAGWTRNLIEVKQLDPVTEIEYTESKAGFVPGVDFLAAGLLGSALMFTAGLAVSKLHPKSKTS